MPGFTLRPLYLRGKSPRNAWDREMSGCRFRAGRCGEENNRCPFRESNPDSPVMIPTDDNIKMDVCVCEDVNCCCWLHCRIGIPKRVHCSALSPPPINYPQLKQNLSVRDVASDAVRLGSGITWN
jgi:hypothetical protein